MFAKQNICSIMIDKQMFGLYNIEKKTNVRIICSCQYSTYLLFLVNKISLYILQ